MKTYLLISLLITYILIVSCKKEKEEANPLVVPYFGQTPPSDEAVIFAPGIISLSNRLEGKIVFSPDSTEVYLGANEGKFYYKRENNVWTAMEHPESLQGFGVISFSVNGNKVYLEKCNNNYSNCDIWIAERTAGGWSTPQMLPEPINSLSLEEEYTETADSLIYLYSGRPEGQGIWSIRQLPDKSFHAEYLSSLGDAFDPCVAADGSYIIFSSNRTGNFGIADLYVSFRNNNEWTVPLNLERGGSEINIAGCNQMKPSISPDGKFLFFNRHGGDYNNPWSDIYWVSTHIIETLREIALPTK